MINKAKILIVDDHPLIRKGLRQILSGASFKIEIDEASNGSESLKKIRDNTFSIVLLDISMPERGGLEILKQIKTQKPILIVINAYF